MTTLVPEIVLPRITVTIPDTVDELLDAIDGEILLVGWLEGKRGFWRPDPKRSPELVAPLRPRPVIGSTSEANFHWDVDMQINTKTFHWRLPTFDDQRGFFPSYTRLLPGDTYKMAFTMKWI